MLYIFILRVTNSSKVVEGRCRVTFNKVLGGYKIT